MIRVLFYKKNSRYKIHNFLFQCDMIAGCSPNHAFQVLVFVVAIPQITQNNALCYRLYCYQDPLNGVAINALAGGANRCEVSLLENFSRYFQNILCAPFLLCKYIVLRIWFPITFGFRFSISLWLENFSCDEISCFSNRVKAENILGALPSSSTFYSTFPLAFFSLSPVEVRVHDSTDIKTSERGKGMFRFYS